MVQTNSVKWKWKQRGIILFKEAEHRLHLEVTHTTYLMPGKEQFGMLSLPGGVSCFLPTSKVQ